MSCLKDIFHFGTKRTYYTMLFRFKPTIHRLAAYEIRLCPAPCAYERSCSLLLYYFSWVFLRIVQNPISLWHFPATNLLSVLAAPQTSAGYVLSLTAVAVIKIVALVVVSLSLSDNVAESLSLLLSTVGVRTHLWYGFVWFVPHDVVLIFHLENGCSDKQ